MMDQSGHKLIETCAWLSRGANQPNMPPTNMKDTVIPKSGGTQNPEATPTTGVNK